MFSIVAAVTHPPKQVAVCETSLPMARLVVLCLCMGLAVAMRPADSQSEQLGRHRGT